jgi:hypothetical protein
MTRSLTRNEECLLLASHETLPSHEELRRGDRESSSGVAVDDTEVNPNSIEVEAMF